MPALRRTTATAASLLAATLSLTTLMSLPRTLSVAAQPRPVTISDLPRLTAELAAVTAHAQQLSTALQQAAARDGGLRVQLSRLQQNRDDAQWKLDARARQVYMADQVDPFDRWQVSASQPDLRELAQRGQQAVLTVDQGLVEAVAVRAGQVRALQARADAFHARLLASAQLVLADQERARGLLAQAQRLVAEAQARAQRLADAENARRLQQQLEAQQAALDHVSADVTDALTPAQTRRSQQAAAEQAPVVALLEGTGSGIPAGYRPSGQAFEGTASWYGPGFVGHPTASGAPYDPERLTCANKELPLGTVIHVSANGLSVNCLVNDRGPYIGDRVLDMSRAGSRAIGYSGLAHVVVEVLVPGA